MREHQRQVTVAPGITVAALLRTPDTPPAPCPVVVHCPGWMSTKDAAHYRRYHEHLADDGVASLVFDYRYTVVPDDPQVLDPADLVTDATAVIGHLAEPVMPVELGPIVLFGSGGIGAGVAIVAGAGAPAVAAVVALSPIASGERWLRWMRRPYEFRDLLAAVRRDREDRDRGEAPATITPVDGISLPPPERAQSGFKKEIADRLPEKVALESVERILGFDVTHAVPDLAPRPLSLIACRDDIAVPYEDAVYLRDLGGPSARLLTLEGTNSYDMHQSRWRDIVDELARVVDEAEEPAATEHHR